MDDAAPARDSADTPPARSVPLPGPLAQPVTRGALLAFAVLMIVAVAAAWIGVRAGQREMRTEVARRLTDADAALAAATARESTLANDLRDAQAKLALLEARLAESQTQQASLEALYRELAPSRDEVALNEVEQVLLLASQQLSIAGNVQAALAALQLADAKLSRIDRPQLVPLRRALSRDIDKLKSVPYVDVAGIAVKLDQAIAQVDTLPLARDERLPPPAPDAAPAGEQPWQRFLRETWSELKSLIRVEVSDRPEAPLVPPQQSYFLRENLRLRLISARIALLAHDDNGFRSDVGAANAWVKKYFDTRAKPVASLQASLAQLAATPMPTEVPDVSASLTALRTLKATRERASGAAPGR